MSDDGKTLAANATSKVHKEDLSTANAATSDADGGATQASGLISRGRRKLWVAPDPCRSLIGAITQEWAVPRLTN